jgi:hypothetical protein
MRHAALSLTLLACMTAADAQTPAPIAPAPVAPEAFPAPSPDTAPPIVSPPSSVPQEGYARQSSPKTHLHKHSMTAKAVANTPNSLNGFGLPQETARRPSVDAKTKDTTTTDATNSSLNYEVGSPEFLAARTRLMRLQKLEGDLMQSGFRSYITTTIDVKHPEVRNHPEIHQLEAALDAYTRYWNLGSLSIDNEADLTLVEKRLYLRLKQEIQGLSARGTEHLNYAGAYSHFCRYLNDPDPIRINHNMAKVGVMYVYFAGQTMYFSDGRAESPDGQIKYTAEPILAQEQQNMTWKDGHVTQGVTFTVQEPASKSKVFFDGDSMDVIRPDGTLYDATRCPPELWDD